MKPLTENARQKNSDSHIDFVTQEINDVPPHLDTITTLESRKASYADYIKCAGRK